MKKKLAYQSRSSKYRNKDYENCHNNSFIFTLLKLINSLIIGDDLIRLYMNIIGLFPFIIFNI